MESSRRGISLLDLLNLEAGLQERLPDSIASKLEALAVLDHRATVSNNAFVHHGTVQSFGEGFALPGMRDWIVELPGVNAGIPFQLILDRPPLTPPAAGATPTQGELEPGPNTFQLDLLLSRFSVVIPGVQPAIVEEVDAAPTHLVRDRTRDKVRLTGSAIFRISDRGTGVTARFVDTPDPLDPNVPTGFVAAVTCEPPSFLIGGSEFGMTVDRILYDGSDSYTPPAIAERGHGPGWTGVSIREATFYCPPSMGYLSVGVRDVLLGDPIGMQGELRVEFGNIGYLDSVASYISFNQIVQADGKTVEDVPVDKEDGNLLRIKGSSVLMYGGAMNFFKTSGTDLPPSGVVPDGYWTLPEHDPTTAASRTSAVGMNSGVFEARPGDVIRFQPRALKDGKIVAQFPELVFHVAGPKKDGQEPKPEHAPTIDVEHGQKSFANVLHLIGSAARLAEVTLKASFAADAAPPDNGDGLEWRLGGSVLGVGPELEGALLPTTPGEHVLVLSDPSSPRTRRILLEIQETATRLIFGCKAGIRDEKGNDLNPKIASFRGVYDLRHFHETGVRRSHGAERPATIAGIKEGQMALAAIPLVETEPTVAHPQALPPPVRAEKVALTPHKEQMQTGQSHFTPSAREELRQFLEEYVQDQERVIIIGRTDDLWAAATNEQQITAYNKQLAEERAEAAYAEVMSFFAAHPKPNVQVFRRGEQSGWVGGTGPDEDSILQCGNPDAIRPARWEIKQDPAWAAIPATNKLPDTPPRAHYRIAEVWVVRPEEAPFPPGGVYGPAVTSSHHVDVLVPGADQTEVSTAVAPSRDRAQASGWRIRLIVKWDSPTLVTMADAVPTLAELRIEWEGDKIKLPGDENTPAKDLPVVLPDSNKKEKFAVTGRWAYDARGGETVFTVRVESLNDPNGLFPTIESATAAAMFGLGPAMISTINPGDGAGAAVSLAAVLATSMFLTQKGIFPEPLIPKGKVAIRAIQGEQRLRSGESVEESRTRITIDYATELHFKLDSPILKLVTAENKPIRIRYKDVGLELRWQKQGGMELRGAYDRSSVEVEDPGQWSLDGPLGKLLRVTAVRSGAGSTWFEFDLALALDLGVVTLTDATVRLTIPSGNGNKSPSVELRGLGVKLDLPGVLQGSGRVTVGNKGDIAGSLEAKLIPVNAKASGSLKLVEVPKEDYTFVHVEIAVLFPQPIPIAPGAGLLGLMGRFVANGTRNLDTGVPDPIEREIKWYQEVPTKKYMAKRGQWAIGLGAVVGTIVDGGYSFHTAGMLTVGFPDLSVVLGVEAGALKDPGEPKEEKPDKALPSLLGLVSIDPASVKIGVRGSYNIPDVLDVKVPISALFPITKSQGPDASDAYVRIGSDGVTPPTGKGYPRHGDPVTLTLLPTTLNREAWAFMMVEEKQLHALGGDDRFNFTGFSLGFGAGFAMTWGGGPVYLTASAKILLGVGTKPMTMVGGIFVRGELWLVIAGVTVTGELVLKLSKDEQWISGKLCGKVSFLFFSVEGCAEFKLGSQPGLPIPHPGNLVTRLELSDRRGVVTGSRDADPGDVEIPVVWPDTVPLLHFKHHLQSNLGSNSSPKVVSSTYGLQPPTGPKWTGSSELKYTYRLDHVYLYEVNGSKQLLKDVPAGWWWPMHRPGLLADPTQTPENEPPPSEHEGRTLALLSWEPGAAWRSLIDGGAGLPGDPAVTVGRICDPVPQLVRVCALGRKAQRTDPAKVILYPGAPPAPPYYDKFEVHGTERLGTLSLSSAGLLLDSIGMYIESGRVIAIAHPIADGGAYEVSAAHHMQRHYGSAIFDARFSTDVAEPTLLLALGKKQPGGRPPEEPRTCVTFGDAEPRNKPAATLQHRNLHFSAAAGEIMFGPSYHSGTPSLRIPVAESTIELPVPCRSVTFRIETGNRVSLRITVLDEDGNVVASDGGVYSPEHTFGFTATRMRRIRITGSPGQPVAILEVCYQPMPQSAGTLEGMYPTALEQGLYDDLFDRNPQSEFPEVMGILPDDSESPWRGAVVAEDDAYIFVEYQPRPDVPSWAGFRVASWTPHRVAVVRCCGNTVLATQQVELEQQNHDALIEQVVSAYSDPETKRMLLKPDTRYEVEVHWSWAGWRKDDKQAEPPSVPAKWETAKTTFEFRTAGLTVPADAPPPTDLITEGIFDPRGVLRYFHGFQVAAAPDTHLLDDKIRAHFSVDYLPQLLDAYEYDMVMAVRRTDMPPGSRDPNKAEEEQAPLDAPHQVAWEASKPWLGDKIDLNIEKAAEEEPCLPGMPAPGKTAVITAQLERNAEYDLLLLARKQQQNSNAPKEEIVIARTHFRTSRYVDAAEILAAFGFAPGNAAGFGAPVDLIVDSPATLMPNLQDDTALDETLHELGLDPLPLSASPRVALLWSAAAGNFLLKGVLLDSDEPLHRLVPRVSDTQPIQERLGVDGIELHGAEGVVQFGPVRANETFTRVLLWTDTQLDAASLAGKPEIKLVLRLRSDGVVVPGATTGAMLLAGAPIHMAEVV